MAEEVIALLRGTEKNPFKARFKEYSVQLDEFNERHERIVKASRDVTVQSKKAIFELHRITSANEEGILEKATAALLSVRKVILAKMAPELTPETYVRHHRAFSPGLQEYIEARTFLSYCQDGSLINLAGMEAEFDGAFTIEPSDYVLGIADLTGELMRRAIAHGGIESVTIHSLLCEVQGCMVGLHRAFKVHKYMESKVKVMNQSVSKVQKRCFDNAIRRAEFQSDPHLKAVNADEPCPKKQKTSTV